DGDGTYDAAAAGTLVRHLLDNRLDLVNARRVGAGRGAYRPGHRPANAVLSALIGRVFGNRFGDMLSGYKVLSRRFVKSFPALAGGFEIETELTVHALRLDMPVAELPTTYRERPAGSFSKLSTWRDGLRILRAILVLFKEERPLAFFTSLFAILAATSIALAWPVVATWLATGLVPRLPTAVLATGLMLLAFLSLACGLVLDTVTRGRTETKRLHYLAQRPPDAG
ncbi:MAG TPA: glycosyl transferase, partial [Thermodesulfobacteriota bacterium]